jgi:hypothetical protein
VSDPYRVLPDGTRILWCEKHQQWYGGFCAACRAEPARTRSATAHALFLHDQLFRERAMRP